MGFISKLRSYGINEDIVLWVTTFLSNRKQRVVINGSMSHWTEVLSGIPQGSILGPLLFIIYINDLVEFCGHDVNLYLFADDAKVFEHIKADDDEIKLQKTIDKFVEWAEEWLVKINYNKCKTMSFRLKGNSDSDTLYTMNDVTLQKVNQIKDLGVNFDQYLLFDRHISEKVSKAFMMLGIIKRNFAGATEQCLLNLYKTMVRPHLEYANQVWHPKRIQDLEQIEKVQKKATKIIVRGSRMTYESRLRKLKLPTLVYRRTRGDMIDTFKLITGKYDENCSLKLNRRSNMVLASETRGHRYKLVLNRCKYDLRKNYFANRIVPVWNSLPDIVVSAESINSFKSRLDKFWNNYDFVYDYRAGPLDTESAM